jgi:hypothetical protein
LWIRSKSPGSSVLWLLYWLKRRWLDEIKQVIYEPLEFMEKLAALVPPFCFN